MHYLIHFIVQCVVDVVVVGCVLFCTDHVFELICSCVLVYVFELIMYNLRGRFFTLIRRNTLKLLYLPLLSGIVGQLLKTLGTW